MDRMKKLILILLIGLLSAALAGAGSPSISPENEENISLGIIIDTSPCSEKIWNLFQTSILELAYHLNNGDQVAIFTAHPGKPKLKITEVIGPEDKYDPGDIVRQTSSFSREFLFGADLSRAIETAFEHFCRKAEGYRCCLVVLSTGSISDRQVKQIKRLSVAFKARGWPLRFVCDRKRANRWLLVAGNNQQLVLRLLEKPELAVWLDAARKPNTDERRSAPDEKLLFNQIKANPKILSATDRYRITGLPLKRAMAAKRSLIRKNLIKETPIESGRRDGSQLFLEIVAKNSSGRPGQVLHNYIRVKAREWYLTQNCTTKNEKSFSWEGRCIYVDLAITWPDGRNEAAEIETEDSIRAIENIRKNLAIGFNMISVLTPNRKVREGIKKRVNREIERLEHHRIRFPAISFYER